MKNLKQMLEILEKFGEDKSYEAKRITTELINILIRNISEEDLEILARIENIDLLFKTARNDKTNTKILAKLIDVTEGLTDDEDDDFGNQNACILQAIAKNRNTDEKTLGRLFKKGPDYLRKEVVKGSNASTEFLNKCAKYLMKYQPTNFSVLEAIASNENTNEETLELLAKVNSEEVKVAVCTNKNFSNEKVSKLLEEPIMQTMIPLMKIIQNDKTDEDILIKIAKMYPNDYLQHLIINHKNVSARVLYEIADLADIKETQVEIAKSDKTDERVLLKLLSKDFKYFDVIYYIIEDGNVTEEILNQIIQKEKDTDIIEHAKKRLKCIKDTL